jgi:hypothetical protein
MPEYQVLSLGGILDYGTDRDFLEQQLKGFLCSRDKQLEDFIHNKALIYESKGFSRTYLVLDNSSETMGGFPPIAAFFTLAITATDYDSVSRSRKEKVLGSKPGRNTFKTFPGMLIAQLARDDRYTSGFINGEALLLECEYYIELGRQYVGGRNIYLDCKKSLVATYQRSDYRLLTDTPTDEGYYKMYKVLPDKTY